MSTRVFSDPFPTFYLEDGVTVNSSGKIFFYEPGTGSTTIKNIYSNSPRTIELLNPVILDSTGKPTSAIFLDGDYRVVEKTSGGVTIRSTDNYQPGDFSSQYGAWDATYTYSLNDIVRFTDNEYYTSLQNNNLGNTPGSTLYWSRIIRINVWNTNETYAEDSIVEYNGNLYTSTSSSNTGNVPDAGSPWSDFASENDVTAAAFGTGGLLTLSRTAGDLTAQVDISAYAGAIAGTTVSASGAITSASVTSTGTIQAEQITSTDDASIAGTTTTDIATITTSATIAGDPVATAVTGTFTPTWNGFSSSPGGDAFYQIIGDYVEVSLPTRTGTSNNISTSISGIPTDIRPSTATEAAGLISVIDSGTTTMAYITVSTSGLLALKKFDDGNWGNTGSKGINGSSISGHVTVTYYKG